MTLIEHFALNIDEAYALKLYWYDYYKVQIGLFYKDQEWQKHVRH